MQELGGGTYAVVREENETEVRDVVYVNGSTTGAIFTTLRKDEGKERAREVSPTPVPRKYAQKGFSLEILQENLGKNGDGWSPVKRGDSELPESITSWNPGAQGEPDWEEDPTLSEYYTTDSNGIRRGPFKYTQRPPVKPANEQQKKKYEKHLEEYEAERQREREEGTLTREEEERHKKLEDETWDEGLPSGIDSDVEFEDPEADAVGLGMVTPTIPAPQTPVTTQQLYEFTGSAIVPPTPNVSPAVSLFAGLEEERKKQKLGAAGAIPPALPPLTATHKPAIKFKPVDAEGDVHIGQDADSMDSESGDEDQDMHDAETEKKK